jgi:deoxycytidylate deaminase
VDSILKKCTEISYALLKKHGDYRCKHFSFIYNKNRLLSIGINNPYKTHPKHLKIGFFNRYGEDISHTIGVHSELSAVLKIGEEDCSKYTIVNTRINRNNQLDLSRPCRGCMSLLDQLNFKKIYYSTSNNNYHFLQL